MIFPFRKKVSSRFAPLFRMVAWGGALGFFVFLGACQNVGPDDSPPLNRRPTWFNFYTRGVEYSRQEEWGRAIVDFEVALGRRPGAQFGNEREQRRARTYGLHYLDDYFPHRELGICLFRQGKLDLAEKELTLSLQMLESARGKYYLNEVRRVRVQQSAASSPEHPIQFKIDLPPGPLMLNRALLSLSGVLSSPYRIDRVTVENSPLFIESAENELSFKRDLLLRPGENRVRIQAWDLTGHAYSWEKEVTVDLEGPTVSVTAAPEGLSSEGDVVIHVADNCGLEAVKINGRLQPRKAIGKPARKRTFRVPAKGEGKIRIDARDRAGNRSQIEVSAQKLQKAAAKRPRSPGGIQLAWAVPARQGKGDRTLDRPSSDVGRKMIASNPPGAGKLVLPKQPPKDTLPPRLKFFPDVPEEIRVTSRFYVLDIQAEDNGLLDSVAVNLKPGGWEERSFRDNQSTVCRFTHTLELARGENSVRVEARDQAGNRRTRQITITRIEDPLWREELRITMQVLPPQAKGGNDAFGTVDLYSMLLDALQQNPRRFNLVERDPVVVRQMLLEMKLSESSLVDYKRAVKTGKMKPARWLLQGHVSVWSGKDNYDLFGKIIDVETGLEILSTDVHFVGKQQEIVRVQLNGFAEKLRQQLPALSGRVSAAKGKKVKLNIGQRDSIRPGMRFLFISGKEEDPDFADPLEKEERWVEGCVLRSRDQQCLVEIFPPGAGTLILPGDIAILR